MSHSWQELADHLRAEAAEYGRLLGLFEEQQKLLFQRDPQSVLLVGRAIQDQTKVLDGLRRRRESAVAGFAQAHGRPNSSTLRSLLDLVPTEGRPLCEALIDEINHLIHRVRRHSRLNYRLLGSVVDCHQELLRRMRPDAFTKTYARDGSVSLSALNRAPMVAAAS